MSKLPKLWISLPNITQVNQLSEQQRLLLVNPRVGGVILFENNIDSSLSSSLSSNLSSNFKSNLTNSPINFLCKFIQDLRQINNTLKFSIDHEGGNVWRIESVFRPPSAKHFGDLYNKDPHSAKLKCQQDVYAMGLDLKKIGIDWCFAPVVDVHNQKSPVIGQRERAFSDQHNIIVDLASAFILGLNKAGVKACIKHFPGHGRCDLDSHTHAPKDDRNLNLWAQDLNIYTQLISKYCANDFDFAIMLGHIQVPNLIQDIDLNKVNNNINNNINNNKYIATYSKSLVHNLLRHKMGYSGQVVSDCLSMHAADIGDLSKRIKSAGDAGCDWLIVANFSADKILQSI